MSRRPLLVTAVLLALLSSTSLFAADPSRDFSGKWLLDARGSDVRALPVPPERTLTIEQKDSAIHCKSDTAHWSYLLDGSESKYKVDAETRNSAVKWEGAALLINTLVSGPQNYVVMDRWKLSRDFSVLTVTRQIMRGTAQSDGIMVYRRDAPPSAAVATPVETASAGTPPPVRTTIVPASPETPLTKRPEPPEPPRVEWITVTAGTRIPLTLLNSVDTKHSQEGDRIYLQTAFPILVGGKIVIPRGSAVAGSVTRAKRPGRVSGKGELYIRFDSLTLPNGVTRDFRSRLGAADASNPGQVDRKEGKVTGEGDKAGDARKVGETTAAGAGVGGLAGAIGGHAGMGVGIGAAAGAAAGLAGVLLSRGPDPTLRKGATLEMILDRDVQYRPDEVRF